MSTTTLYLRSIPAELVRAAKSAAALRGSTLGALVTEALADALQQSEPPEELATSMAWYEDHRGTLFRRYPNQHVAIVGNRVIDHDDKFEALAERVFARHGVKPVFMPRVTREERPMRFRSPRRVKS